MSGAAPTMLLTKPKRRKGIRRLNYMPVWFGTGAVCIVIAVIGYTYADKIRSHQEADKAADASQTKGGADQAKDVLATTASPAPTSMQRQGTYGGQPAAAAIPAAASTDIVAAARVKAWQAYYQQLATMQAAKADAEIKAMSAGTNPTQVSSGGQSNPAWLQGGAAGSPGGPPYAAPGEPPLPVAGTDAGGQAEKRAFLRQGGDPLGAHEDLMADLHAPKLDTIMQGTAIPGVMIGGLTSDMPGMIVGSVDRNVYDTATGDHLLIPQGTRVVGTYDNSVSQGQARIGVIWNRFIFPDTSSIQLGSMEGADQGGYAGFHDLVDSHFWEKFLAATVISFAGAAAQVAQPQQSAFSGYSPSSVASGQLTQGYSQLGQEYARAGLSIPNTLEVRPGYNFVLMVNKDLHLPPYVDRRNANFATPRRQVMQ